MRLIVHQEMFVIVIVIVNYLDFYMILTPNITDLNFLNYLYNLPIYTIYNNCYLICTFTNNKTTQIIKNYIV